MSFTFPTFPAASGRRRQQAATAEASRLRGTALLVVVAALVAIELALVALRLEESRGAMLLWLGLPLALFVLFRQRAAVPPAVVRKASPPTRSFSANRAALAEIGDAMLAQSRRDGEPLSVIVFDQSDLPELRSIFGSAAVRQMVARIGATLDALAGRRGFAVRTEATEFTVLIPGHDVEQALARIRQTLGDSYAIEVGAQHDEILLVPDFLARTVPADAASVEEVYQSMRAAIGQAQRDQQRRQRHLQRERESHSARAALG